LKEGIKFIAIFVTCFLMGVAVAHPLGWTIMILDEVEVDRTIK
jgi:hypothetical protein